MSTGNTNPASGAADGCDPADHVKDMPGHDCMIDKYGDLKDAAACIPAMRNRLENLAPTAATWNPLQTENTHSGSLRPNHLAIIGSWKVPDVFPQSKGTKYVNPAYVHVGTYAGVFVECECGSAINTFRGNDHGDGCDGGDRKAARERLQRRRAEEIERLALHGWTAPEIATRLGISDGAVKEIAADRAEPLSELREEYRRLQGETYAHLVGERGVLGKDVAEIYGDNQNTILSRAERLADYEPMSEQERCRRSLSVAVDVPDDADYVQVPGSDARADD